jgi:hypothetical protein
MPDVEQTGPVITEQTPTSQTTETRIVSTEERPAVVSTVADVEAAIQPYVQRLATLEGLFTSANIVSRLEEMERHLPALQQQSQGTGHTIIDRLIRIEQIIKLRFGAHQLATAEPQGNG